MEIEIYTGRTLLQATKNALAQLDDSSKIQNYVIVPDRFSLQAELLVLKSLKSDVSFWTDVLGLSRLCYKLLPPEDTQDNMQEGGLALMYEAMKNVCKNFVYYKKVDVDICQKFWNFVSLLKSSNISTAMLKTKIDDTYVSAKLHDISLVYAEYEKLRQNKLDDNALLDKLIDYILNVPNLEKKCFYFVNFDSFTEKIYRLLDVLCIKAEKVVISLANADSVENDYIYDKDILEKLKQISKRHDVKISVFEGKTDTQDRAYPIIHNLYSFNPVQCKDKDFFKIVSCESVSNQIEFVAKYIKFQVQKGYKFSDFSVACDDLKSQRTEILRVFTEYKICHFADESISLDQTFLGEFVLDVLQSLCFGLDEDFIKYFITIFAENGDEAVKVCIEKNINNFAKIEMYLSEQKYLFETLKSGLSKKTYAEISNFFLDFLEKNGKFYERIKDFLEKNNNLLQKQVFDIAQEKLKNLLKNLCKSDSCTLIEYLKLLKICMAECEVFAIPESVNSVFVGDATKSFFERRRYLLVVGADNLPAVTKETSLLGDDELEKVSFAYKIEPTVFMINRRNRFKLFEALNSPTEKLICLCKDVQECLYLTDLQKIFGTSVVQESSFFDTAFAKGFNLDQGSLTKFVLGTRLGALKNITRLKRSEDEKSVLLAEVGYDVSCDKTDLQFISSGAKELFFPKNYAKVSQLERYFVCPFCHFLEKGLKINVLEEHKLQKKDVGSILHSAFYDFLTAYLNGTQFADANSILQFAQSRIDSYILSVCTDFEVDKKTKEYIVNQIVKSCEKILYEQQNSKFKADANFLEKKIFVKDYFDAGGQKLDFYGVLDRADFYGNYVRVIDYKTGKTAGVLDELYYGKKVQLVCYMSALEQQTKKEFGGIFYFDAGLGIKDGNATQRILNGIYPRQNLLTEAQDIRLFNVGFKSDIVGGEKKVKPKPNEYEYKYTTSTDVCFDKMESYAKDLINLAIAEILSGYVAPNPLDGACECCKYKSICRFSGNARPYKSAKNFWEGKCKNTK